VDVDVDGDVEVVGVGVVGVLVVGFDVADVGWLAGLLDGARDALLDDGRDVG
jgi:hypothetical protein